MKSVGARGVGEIDLKSRVYNFISKAAWVCGTFCTNCLVSNCLLSYFGGGGGSSSSS